MTKTFDAAAVREAHAAGLHRFGENYVQEGVDKIEALADLRPSIEWHLIGPLQSNKTRLVTERFDWVQSVDRLRIAERLSAQRPAALAPLQVLLQVNVSGETTKSGLAPADVREVAAAVARLPRLVLRGLMAIPEPSNAGEAATGPGDGADRERRPLRAMRALFEQLQSDGLAIDTLSIGMSADLEPAIAEGSTMVRVGSALFGERPRA